MESIPPWRTLRLGDGVPQVLVKAWFNDDGYDIQLTDLSRVWGESLSKDEIVERALATRCSIEPSEPDQYHKFVEKIANALEAKNGTELALNSTPDGLSLRVSAPLPKPLPPFKWAIKLMRLPDTAVAAELVTPLLNQANNLQHHIQQLIDELAAKDHVISKITDRLEQSKINLQDVFPGASNMKINQKGKKSQREQLAGHIKGIADFDEDAWRASKASPNESEEHSPDFLDVVMKDVPHHTKTRLEVEDEWWRNLDGFHGSTPQSDFSSRKSDLPHGQTRFFNKADSFSREKSNEEGGFQQHSTPPFSRHQQVTPSTEDDGAKTTPNKSSRQASARLPPDDDESTEDEDDLDVVPSQKSSHTKGRSQQQDQIEQPAPQLSKPRRLGAMSGRKAKSSTPESASTTSPARGLTRLGAMGGKATSPVPETGLEVSPAGGSTTKPKLGAFGVRKQSKTPEPSVSPDEANEDAQVRPLEKPKSKLGAFGGKAKTARRSPTPDEPDSPNSKPKSKLGTFGGRAMRDAGAHSADDVDMTDAVKDQDGGRASSTAEAQAETQEADRKTEELEETADQRRQRLKRELEEKSKAPVKKKRKF